MNQQIKILNKEIKIIHFKKKQRNSQVENYIIEMKNWLGETNSLEYLNSEFETVKEESKNLKIEQ